MQSVVFCFHSLCVCVFTLFLHFYLIWIFVHVSELELLLKLKNISPDRNVLAAFGLVCDRRH